MNFHCDEYFLQSSAPLVEGFFPIPSHAISSVMSPPGSPIGRRLTLSPIRRLVSGELSPEKIRETVSVGVAAMAAGKLVNLKGVPSSSRKLLCSGVNEPLVATNASPAELRRLRRERIHAREVADGLRNVNPNSPDLSAIVPPPPGPPPPMTDAEKRVIAASASTAASIQAAKSPNTEELARQAVAAAFAAANAAAPETKKTAEENAQPLSWKGVKAFKSDRVRHGTKRWKSYVGGFKKPAPVRGRYTPWKKRTCWQVNRERRPLTKSYDRLVKELHSEQDESAREKISKDLESLKIALLKIETEYFGFVKHHKGIKGRWRPRVFTYPPNM
jgi:hypothetical protein